MERVRKHLSYANVISTLGLFLIVSGGTAVALTGFNSVESNDIINGQVRRADIQRNAINGTRVANNTLRGSDVVESTFGKVPSASEADNADTATNASNSQALGGDAANEFPRIVVEGDLPAPASIVATDCVLTNETVSGVLASDHVLVTNAETANAEMVSTGVAGADVVYIIACNPTSSGITNPDAGPTKYMVLR
jgi:hypothetical protein